jgi:hypothetical protein
LFLQFLQFLEKLVVFAVGDELPAFDVIGVVVPADFVGESGMAGQETVSKRPAGEPGAGQWVSG